MTTETVFKLRAANGLFSTGGSTPEFHPTGKSWRRQKDLTNHLVQLRPKWMTMYIEAGVEVIECEISIETRATTPVADWAKDLLQRKLVRASARRSTACMLKRVSLLKTIDEVTS